MSSDEGSDPKTVSKKGAPATAAEYAKLQGLVFELAPYVYTHPIEKYYMCDVDEFTVDKSEWMPSENWRTLKEGVPKDYAVHQKQTPVKYNIVTDEKYHYIIYHLFHAYNGPKRVLALVPVEDHDGDIENFVARIDRETLEVVDFRLSLHGDFTVSTPSELEATGSGNPIVYSAVNSHALYPSPGTYFRKFGLGNDQAAKGQGTQTVPQPALESVSWANDKDGRLAKKITGRFTDPHTYAIRNDIDLPWKVPGGLVYMTMTAGLVLLPAVVSVICFYLGVSPGIIAGVACCVAVAQVFLVKICITTFFKITEIPAGPPVPDTWAGWLLPLQIR